LRDLVIDLARGLRGHVLPLLGRHAGRGHVHTGASGDVTFEIDQRAEAHLEAFIAQRAPGVAYYSEDRGLVWPGGGASPAGGGPGGPPSPSLGAPSHPLGAQSPSWVLVVDPIDGTRPAIAGFESCCVSVAAAPLAAKADLPSGDLGGERGPRMRDVQFGCVTEIKSGATFMAERGAGIEVHSGDGSALEPALSPNTDLSRMFWALGLRGRPAAPLMRVLGDLVDQSSVGGAVFDLGSATYDMTRILTGQLDAYVTIGTRMIEEAPALRARFEEVGGGTVLNNSPYDLAAAVLCLEEAGAIVTDGYGDPLGPRPLLGSGHEFQMSCVAASGEVLHARVLEAVERGMERLRDDARLLE
jgi:myo-inositol-1(or 4)-monophosphatase